MIELRKLDVWDQYLPKLFSSQLGIELGSYKIDSVDTGMMNYVFRVRTDNGIFFFKQAFSKAKADEFLGPALQTISSQRLEYEKNCIVEISTVLPDNTEIPTVHHYDPENHILVLSNVAGSSGKLLETALLEGIFDVAAASAVGRFLGAVHRCTWGTRRSIRGSRRNDRKNWERFLDMRTRGVSSDWLSSEITEGLNTLHSNTILQHSYDVLTLMDCCPKNIVVRKDQKIGVFDFELASWKGDPAYDLGFFIGHYLIHAMQNNALTMPLQAIAGCIHAYSNEVQGLPFQKGMMIRALKYSAATIIYRVAGASRLKYIEPESAPYYLKRAGNLLCSAGIGEADEAISLMEDALA